MSQSETFDLERIRQFIGRCEWRFAKTMPQWPHEYIVRGNCPLTDEEFLYFIRAERESGIQEPWGPYNHTYLYIDDYKYWTMGAPYEQTTVINRANIHEEDDILAAQSLVRSFISERLDGDIDKLAGFDFALLKGDSIYGTTRQSNFDCDDTFLARAILTILFRDLWPGLTYNNIQRRVYRGDTINSFRTLFGPETDGRFPVPLKFGVSTELYDHIVRFHSTYHTIGNFMILPNYFHRQYRSFNLFRGALSGWRDYADRFLMELKNALSRTPDADSRLIEIIDQNKFAFNAYKHHVSYNDIVDQMYLTRYNDYISQGKLAFKGISHNKPGLTAEEYQQEALLYLDFCESFIRERSQIMIVKLKEVLYL